MVMKRKLVAVVDDDPAMRRAMARLLSTLGYGTELFASGEAFLNAAPSSEAACLVVDIQLGDISGLEMGRQLAADGRKVPIIFVTACDDETIHREAAEFGCVAYLMKPFSSDLLIEAIARAIDRSPENAE
jgi:FixJ family two-component response regulator